VAKSNLNTQAKRKRQLAKMDKRAAKDEKRAAKKAQARLERGAVEGTPLPAGPPAPQSELERAAAAFMQGVKKTR
jgi:hypothetical protein